MNAWLWSGIQQDYRADKRPGGGRQPTVWVGFSCKRGRTMWKVNNAQNRSVARVRHSCKLYITNTLTTHNITITIHTTHIHGIICMLCCGTCARLVRLSVFVVPATRKSMHATATERDRDRECELLASQHGQNRFYHRRVVVCGF